MSYARFASASMVEKFGDDPDMGVTRSDVYVYLDCGGYLCCCACRLGDQWQYDSTEAIVAHLREHIAAGHVVPDDVIPALESDRAENDAWITDKRPKRSHA